MEIVLSDRVAKLKPSASIAAKAIVNELRAQGRHIIDFTIGEPDLDTPAAIIDAAIAAMRSGDTHYTATNGTQELRQAISDKLRRENGVDMPIECIVVGAGAKQLIFETCAATLNPGDEVIIPAPYWVSYPDIVSVNDGRPVIVPCPRSNGFKLAAQALEAAITPRTRWLILNTPSNPTGAVYSRNELAALATVLQRHPHVAIMTDDIYEHLIYDGEKVANLLEVAPELIGRVLLINGLSKAYAMTGWRIGYAAGPKNLIGAIVKLLGQSTTCASSISQAAAAAALNGDQTPVREMTALYEARRNRMHALLSAIPGIECDRPTGAFYIYPDVSALIGRKTPEGKLLESDVDVTLYLLQAANVAVMDGSAYGMSPALRLSFATSDEAIDEGCARIGQACAALI